MFLNGSLYLSNGCVLNQVIVPVAYSTKRPMAFEIILRLWRDQRYKTRISGVFGGIVNFDQLPQR